MSRGAYLVLQMEAGMTTKLDRCPARSSAYFEALVEASTDVIAITDRAGTLCFVSPSCEALVGLPPAALVGRSFLEWVHPDDVARVVAELRRVGDTPNATGRAHYRIRHTSGTYRHVETRGRNRFDDPSVRGLVTSTRDRTETFELESQLQQAAKVEVVGRLAGGIAHDFNNLLTVIAASAELLAADLPADAAAMEDVDEIRDAARRAARLTRGLLAFSRKEVARPRDVSLSELVRDLEPLLRRLIGEDIVLVTEVDDVPPVRGDPGQLEQVLLNLIINAREAMPTGGRLVVQVRTAPAAREEPGPQKVRLLVCDTGVGMAPEVLARIFDPFFTTKETGTGLGLATVYGIVEQIGGTVSAESQEGIGSVFLVSLPAVAADALRGRSGRPPPARHASDHETVLVVEDDESLRVITRRVLERLGYVALTASNGGEALALAADASLRIDLLVADVVMPGMSGREVAEAVHRLRPGLPTLYTSGYLDETLRRHGIERNGVRLLPKPFTSDSLARAVRETLDDVSCKRSCPACAAAR